MVLVTRYKHLCKADAAGTFGFLRPLRAVGLAVEAGHKAAQQKGLSKVTADDLAVKCSLASSTYLNQNT